MKAFKCVCSEGEFVIIATDIGNTKIVFSRNYPSYKIRDIQEIVESGVYEVLKNI